MGRKNVLVRRYYCSIVIRKRILKRNEIRAEFYRCLRDICFILFSNKLILFSRKNTLIFHHYWENPSLQLRPKHVLTANKMPHNVYICTIHENQTVYKKKEKDNVTPNNFIKWCERTRALNPL